MIGAIATIVLFPLVGLAASRLVGRMNAFLAGAGCIGFGFYVAGLAHIPIVATAATMLGLSCVAILRIPKVGNEPMPRFPTLPAVLFVAVATVLVAIALIVPNHDYDGRAFWLLKAKAIAHEKSIDGPFFHGSTVNPRNQYPLLIPIDAAVLMSIARNLEDDSTRALYVLFGVALAYEAGRRLARLSSPSIGAWLALIILLLPQIATEKEGGVLSAYSDVALGAFVACAFFELLDAESPARFGLWAAFATLTKSEGLPLAAVLVIIALVRFRLNVIRAAVPVATAVATLLLWRAQIPRSDEQDFGRKVLHVFGHGDAFLQSISELIRQPLAFHDWGFFGLAVAAGGVSLMLLRDRRILLPSFVIAPMLLLYAAVFAVSGWPIEVLISNLAPRVMTHLIGPALYVVATSLARLDGCEFAWRLAATGPAE